MHSHRYRCAHISVIAIYTYLQTNHKFSLNGRVVFFLGHSHFGCFPLQTQTHTQTHITAVDSPPHFLTRFVREACSGTGDMRCSGAQPSPATTTLFQMILLFMKMQLNVCQYISIALRSLFVYEQW